MANSYTPPAPENYPYNPHSSVYDANAFRIGNKFDALVHRPKAFKGMKVVAYCGTWAHADSVNNGVREAYWADSEWTCQRCREA